MTGYYPRRVPWPHAEGWKGDFLYGAAAAADGNGVGDARYYSLPGGYLPHGQPTYGSQAGGDGNGVGSS